jgi:hypothetical protein
MPMAEVRLRRWRLEDAADVAEIAGDRRVRPWSATEDVLDIEIGNVASDRVAQAFGAELRHPGREVVDRLGDTHTMAVWVIAQAGA